LLMSNWNAVQWYLAIFDLVTIEVH